MKKLIFTAMLAAFLIVTALPLSAHDEVTYAEWGTPVIDGTKEAIWDRAQRIYVADEAMTDVGDETAVAYVYSLWDGEYIYFYAEITDKTVDAEHKDDAWNQDAMGFMIDYSYFREPEVSFRDLGDDSYAGYVNVCAVEGTKNYPEVPTIFGIQKYIDPIQSYCKLTPAGYEIEIRLPLAVYKTYNPGDRIGYEICLNNSVGNGERASQTVWKYAEDARGNDSWQYTYNMGTLIFNEKPEPEAIAETPAAEIPVVTADAETPVVTAAQTADTAAAAISVLAAACLAAVVISRKKSR
ncbi:MAG: sugar-binding protein [Eubacteriales bacterium]|nr:sugar-binding protein [Eubacteriales bacterium]